VSEDRLFLLQNDAFGKTEIRILLITLLSTKLSFPFFDQCLRY